MTLARHFRAPASDQKIEVGALMRLQDMLDIELLIAPSCLRRWRRPGRSAPVQDIFGDEKIELPCFHIQFDLVTILDQRQIAARRRLRRNVQHRRSVGGSAHTGVRNPHRHP